MSTDPSTADQRSDAAARLGARVDRLPGWGLSRAALVLLGISSAFSFYDITSMGVVLPAVAEEFGTTKTGLAIVISMNLLGYIVGSMILGAVADRVGRRPAYVVTLVVLAGGSLLTALAWDVASLTLFRLLTGAGTGAQIALVTTLFAELSSAKRRGFYLQANQVVAGVGLTLAPWLAVALVDEYTHGWRVVLGVGALAIAAVPLGWLMPESPRWLALRGRIDEAEHVVGRMEDTVRGRGMTLPEPVVSPADDAGAVSPLSTLLRQPYLGRLVALTAFWFLFYLTSYSFLGFQTTLLDEIGLLSGSSVLITAIGSFGYVLGPLVATAVVERFERKYLLVAVTLMEALGALLLATAGSNVMAGLGGLLIAAGIMAGTVGYTYTAEILPTEARATAVAIAQGGGHLAGVVGPFLTVAVLGAFGPRVTFVQIAASIIIAGLIILLTGRRTTGLALGRTAR